jgi:hypothetical protein
VSWSCRMGKISPQARASHKQVRWHYIRHPQLVASIIFVCFYLTCSFLALIMLALIIFIILFRWGAKSCASRHPRGPGRTPAAAIMVQGDEQVSNWYRHVSSVAESPHLMLSSLTYVCIVYTHFPQLPGCSRTPRSN